MSRGAHMREAREKAGLSLRDLATRTGISSTGISQLERGIRQGNIITIELLADALGISIDEYVGHEKKGVRP